MSPSNPSGKLDPAMIAQALLGTSEIQISRVKKLDRTLFLREFETFLKQEFIKRNIINGTPFFVINRARVRDSADFMVKWGYHLQNIYCSELQKAFELNYIFHCRPYVDNSEIVVQTQVDKTIKVPSIQDLFPNAKYFETNLTHRLGIDFQLPISSKTTNAPSDILCLPIKIHPPMAEKNSNQLGIFHPVHRSYDYIDGFVENEQIKQVELRDGWLYDKIQPKLEKRNPFADFTSLFEQISEQNHVNLHLLHYSNLEFLSQKNPPAKVKFLRILYAELERIRSHLLWFINLADLLTFDKYYTKLNQLYARLTRCYGKYFLNGNLKNTIKYNGALDILGQYASDLRHELKDLGKDIFNECYNLTYESYTEESCIGVGKISKKDAIRFGLTGPALRGSGIPIDVRYSDPYLNYCTGEISQLWSVITFPDGDVHARTQVRLWEFRESLEICDNIIDGLSNYDSYLKTDTLPNDYQFDPEKQILQTVESPQGALSLYYRTAPDKKSPFLYTVRILTPDAANYSVLEHKMLLNEAVEKAPLIVHSLDLNFSMLDL